MTVGTGLFCIAIALVIAEAMRHGFGVWMTKRHDSDLLQRIEEIEKTLQEGGIYR